MRATIALLVISLIASLANPMGISAFAQSAAVSNPSLAIGLSGVTDYAPQLPFIDLIKSGRTWTAHLRGGWGGLGHDELEAGGYLDENGWPRSFPPGVTGISILVLTDLPEGAISVSGRYRLRYEGQGLVEITSGGKIYAGSRGEGWFMAEAGAGPVVVTIVRTDPNDNGEYIRNLTIVKEENIPAFEAGEIFNPIWVNHIKDMRVLRFMDWMSTNDSTDSAWADRPKTTDYTYAHHGVPLEIMIKLANEVGADPWFNMPHLATDDYIREFATMVRDDLDPRLKAYVELSNEVWNWQFAQAKWAEENGQARWGAESKWVQFYALRASQMASIWDETFADMADSRLVNVISTQTGWLGLEEDILWAPMWMAENSRNAPPHTFFDAYAITGYLSASLGNETAPMVLEWLKDGREQADRAAQDLQGDARVNYIEAHKYDLAIERAAQELTDGSVSGDPEGGVMYAVETMFPYHAAVARKYGLDLIMYEGGTHVVGIGEWTDNDELTAFFTVFNYTPEMGELYAKLMAGWKSAGGTLFNVFVDVNTPSKWGSWGALRHLDDSNPRWDAIKQFNAENPAWWEERPAGTFDGTVD